MAVLPAVSQQTIDAFVGAAHGNLNAVKELLAGQSGLINAHASWDETALGAAAHTAQREIAGLLLSVGAPMDICTATMLGLRERVARFLRDDAGLAQARGAHGLPVLYYAAISGQREAAELLLAHGADVAAAQDAALFGAVRFGQPAMVEWLLAHGAHSDARDAEGRQPLDLALELGQTEVAAVLRRYGATTLR